MLLADPWESPAAAKSGLGHVRETDCLWFLEVTKVTKILFEEEITKIIIIA